MAAPVLLVWSTYAIVKGSSSVANTHIFSASHETVPEGILLTVELLIGVTIFENEPGNFRYA